ncbi:polysaccharide deacetylase [Rhodovulum sp. PH10]|uniref:polysaccharide deacetylase family protein n=1 Tax=Rhodovulum sp. PH10 TaxID=1187851 RepID=UPI00027C2641|nr:polysaccharide deacetylase family protein [Rhodovulum sp. PH10]EJW12116.1 polysaccharide deacetylase [Rhodovulum sp. PH10]
MSFAKSGTKSGVESGPSLPSAWPERKTLAVSVSIMLEQWTDDSAPGIGPMGNPLKSGTLDLQARNWSAYGPEVGALRILDILDAAGVKAVFYTSGILCERHPDLIRTIVDAGHEIAAHAWGQNIVPATQSAEDETRDLARCIEVIERTAGKKPRGWLSPRCTPSARTTDLLIGSGFAWHADFFDRDLPRTLKTEKGAIVAMPFTMEVNDMPLYIKHGGKPEDYTAVLERLVTGWPAIGNRPGCIDVTIHAHVFGRPAGAIEFARSLALVKSHAAYAWLTDHASLAEMWADA